MTEVCIDCKFSHSKTIHKDQIVECRRYPPDNTKSVIDERGHVTGRWPTVEVNDWCGEWKHAP